MANCMSKNKLKDDPAEPIIIPDFPNSKISFPSQILKSRFSVVACPIENSLIIECKKELEEEDLFTYDFNQFKSIEKKEGKWRVAHYRQELKNTHDNFKYWFYGAKTVNQVHGRGLLYCRGKYSQFLVEGNFNHNDVSEDEKYLKIFGNGMAYFGPLNSQLEPQGLGELIYNKDDRYIGQFRMGLPHGEGERKAKDYKFTGSFAKGEKLNGVFEDVFGKYEGNFVDNMKEGHGSFTNGNGVKYIGNFKKNKKNGLGEVYDDKGSLLYKGVWKNDQLVSKMGQ